MNILIIEDNEILAKNLAKYLELKNFQTDRVISVEDAKQKMKDTNYDLLILDINLPGESGLKFCESLRIKLNDISIIMLTSSNTSEDIIIGLEKGADDYIGKPFDYDELLARIKAVSRRKIFPKSENKDIIIGNVEINFGKQIVKVDGIPLNMSNLEFNLLKYFIERRGKVINRVELLEQVWGEFDRLMFSRTVDIHIGYLRKKIGKDFIKTVKGSGYILD